MQACTFPLEFFRTGYQRVENDGNQPMSARLALCMGGSGLPLPYDVVRTLNQTSLTSPQRRMLVAVTCSGQLLLATMQHIKHSWCLGKLVFGNLSFPIIRCHSTACRHRKMRLNVRPLVSQMLAQLWPTIGQTNYFSIWQSLLQGKRFV